VVREEDHNETWETPSDTTLDTTSAAWIITIKLLESESSDDRDLRRCLDNMNIFN
jgi:hypothetical protein